MTLHRPDAQRGFNLWSSGHAPAAFLMEMDGTLVHRWEKPFHEIWPDVAVAHPNVECWRRVHLLDHGDLLAIFEGYGLIKLDAASELLWRFPGRPHHDLEVLPDGRIYVLTRVAHLIPRLHPTQPILEDFISVLSPEGQELHRVSLIQAFENSTLEAAVWRDVGLQHGDIFHTNTLALLDGSHAGRHPEFQAGRVLISLLGKDLLAVVDLEDEKVVWALRGSFRRQHDPRLLDNGRLLLFDNHWQPRRSRVIEIEPRSGAVQWSYRDQPKHPFFSATCGTAQRLANGHTLITESDAGRALEVTTEGDMVWEFVNPHRAGENEEFVATLFEMQRLPADTKVSWAAGGEE